jgi:Uma2 family endonuclease
MIQFTQVQYPETDGKPMGETDEHREEMVRHIELLNDFFAGQQVYVSGNLLVYYEQGNPRKYVVPDAFVAKGVAPKKRRVYKIWVEGKAPDIVIETTSRKTRRKDTVDKPQLYARLGIQEYFLFDPDQEYLEPPLQGYRLQGAVYVPMHPVQTTEPHQANSLISQELGLRLCLGDEVLQFYRLDTGERLLTRMERAAREAERAASEAERADREALAREEAEAELARLREELARRNAT